MKIVVRFDFPEHVLRAIRAGQDRGGVATRKEAKAFVEVAVRTAQDRLPAPKVRAPKATDVERRTFVKPQGATEEETARLETERIRRIYRRTNQNGLPGWSAGIE